MNIVMEMFIWFVVYRYGNWHIMIASYIMGVNKHLYVETMMVETCL